MNFSWLWKKKERKNLVVSPKKGFEPTTGKANAPMIAHEAGTPWKWQCEKEAEVQVIENQIEIVMMLKTNKVEMTGTMTKGQETLGTLWNEVKRLKTTVTAKKIPSTTLGKVKFLAPRLASPTQVIWV